jgi:hypothetical protein
VTPCPICGEPVPEGRGRRYCSPRCRKAAERGRARAKAAEEFAAAAADIPKTGDRAEVLALLMVSAKAGSVMACKILLEELRRDGEVPPTDFIDELARRRDG